MILPEKFSLSDYLNSSFPCECGKNHTTNLKDVEISSDALEKVPNYIIRYSHKKSLIICDKNTYKACGEKLKQILDKSGCTNSLYILSAEDVVPNEEALGELMVAIDRDTDLIIAVGTGSINDLCKFISFKMNIEYFIVGTAPSMDGFASEGSPLITNNMKTTYPTHTPQVIIGDLNILSAAPMEMITAGVGDTLGKYTCLVDWKIANIINGEYYCPVIVKMVETSLKKVVDNIKLVKTRDQNVIANIMEALILTGIAMSFAGYSRPASGSEHHLSHYWEMKFLFEGRKPVLHGTKVGIGAVASDYLYGILKNKKIDFDKARSAAKEFNFETWKSKVKEAYGYAAPGVIKLEKEVGKNNTEKRLARIESIQKHWDEIIKVINTLPQVSEIERMLSELGAPINPAQVGVDDKSVYDGIIYAKELRDRYTLFQLLWDLGIEDEMAEKAVRYFKSEQNYR